MYCLDFVILLATPPRRIEFLFALSFIRSYNIVFKFWQVRKFGQYWRMQSVKIKSALHQLFMFVFGSSCSFYFMQGYANFLFCNLAYYLAIFTFVPTRFVMYMNRFFSFSSSLGWHSQGETKDLSRAAGTGLASPSWD